MIGDASGEGQEIAQFVSRGRPGERHRRRRPAGRKEIQDVRRRREIDGGAGIRGLAAERWARRPRLELRYGFHLWRRAVMRKGRL